MTSHHRSEKPQIAQINADGIASSQRRSVATTKSIHRKTRKDIAIEGGRRQVNQLTPASSQPRGAAGRFYPPAHQLAARRAVLFRILSEPEQLMPPFLV